MKFIAQGTILSNVACHNEREVRARQLGKPIEEVPLTFGSLRMGVNLIKLDDTVFNIDRKTNNPNIKEQRLILEISYKFDKQGDIIEAHQVIEELEVNKKYELVMDSGFITEKHYLKFISAGNNKTIKSYFIKSWADNIYFLTEPELQLGAKQITPKEVVKKFSLNEQLVIA